MLLDFIGSKEAPKGYDTVYANRMDRMPKPLPFLMLKEILDQGKWRTKTFGSSACGRYQFMDATLRDLAEELDLKAEDRFTPDYQDRLGFHLLRCRGYDKWIKGALSDGAFMRNLAKEWASFPVPDIVKGSSRTGARGQSFYAGHGLNKARVPHPGSRREPRQDATGAPMLLAGGMSADVGLAASITEKGRADIDRNTFSQCRCSEAQDVSLSRKSRYLYQR
ncbi:hypothetical protein [Microvirga lotononidis]|nr:hypothetical protein [Microvirga lotononidis]